MCLHAQHCVHCTTLLATHTYTVHFDLAYMCHIVGKPSKVQTFVHQVDIQIYGGGGGGGGAELWHSMRPAMQGHDHKNYNFAKENFRCQSKNCEMRKDFSFSELFPLPPPCGVSAGGVLHLAGIPKEEVEASEGPEAREEAAASHAAARTLRRTPP